MNKERLLKLADLLEADAARSDGIKFDLNHVIAVPQCPDGGIVKLDCGTYACAVGLAAISGAFEDAGLGYRFGASGFEVTVHGKGRGWSDAAAAVFGLGKNEVEFLFTSYDYQQTQGAGAERMVASRIRDMVAGDVIAPQAREYEEFYDEVF